MAVNQLGLSQPRLPSSATSALVRKRGFEPPPSFEDCLLRTACLPFHHSRKDKTWWSERDSNPQYPQGTPVLQTGAHSNRASAPNFTSKTKASDRVLWSEADSTSKCLYSTDPLIGSDPVSKLLDDRYDDKSMCLMLI